MTEERIEEKLRESVYTVWGTSEDGTKKHFGNAVAVGPHLLLTCRHVVWAVERGPKRELSFQLSSANADARALTISGKPMLDQEIDLAFIKVEEDLAPIPVGKDHTIRNNSGCYLCGSAPNSDFCVPHKEVESIDSPETYYQLNGGSHSGRSGSPVVKVHQGKPILVGVAYKGGDGAAVTTVHTAARVLGVAKELGVKVVLADGEGLGPEISEIFPDEPHAKVMVLLNALIDVEGELRKIVSGCSPNLLDNSGQLSADKVSKLNGILPRFFRDLAGTIDVLGLQGLSPKSLRTLSGGLLVLCISPDQVGQYRETLLDGIVRIGDPDLLLGNDLKDFLCHLPEIYHAAVADCLLDVDRVFSERNQTRTGAERSGPRRLPTFEDGTESEDRAKVMLKQAVMEVMGFSADERHLDPENEKFKEVVAAVQEALQDANPFQIHGGEELVSRLELLRASDYWEVFRYFVFYDISGENEAMIPGYRQIMPALFKVLRSIDAATSNQSQKKNDHRHDTIL